MRASSTPSRFIPCMPCPAHTSRASLHEPPTLWQMGKGGSSCNTWCPMCALSWALARGAASSITRHFVSRRSTCIELTGLCGRGEEIRCREPFVYCLAITYCWLITSLSPLRPTDLGRMYGRALFILAAIQGCALIIENSYDNSIIFVWLCTYSCGLQNSSKY